MDTLASVAKFAQNCSHTNPVIVVGSGASVPFGLPGMEPLAQHLLTTIITENEADEDSWLLVKTALANGDHLEQALAKHPLSPSLVSQVVRHTWSLISAHDKDVFSSVIRNNFRPPMAKIFSHFFNTSNNTVDVVTTNYDRVLEYTCDVVGIHYKAAFQPSYVSAFDSQDRRVLTHRGRPVQTVRLWKVHGSLDWFLRDDGVTLRAPIFDELVDCLEPLIVTPGVSKFERLSEEPFRSTLQGADSALGGANGFLCFGFGFRDRQIEPKMVERLTKKNVPIVVATRTLTDEALNFLQTKAKSNFLALEKGESGTIARSADNWSGIHLDGDYWSVDGFLKLITPGVA